MTFDLHPQLAADTIAITDLALSTVLLMDDRRFPWLILVPRRPGLREIHELDAGTRTELMEEITRTSKALQQTVAPDKINIGALGNLVPHLHIHVVARFRDDPAWPGPVWGSGPRQPYETLAATKRVNALRRALAG